MDGHPVLIKSNHDASGKSCEQMKKLSKQGEGHEIFVSCYQDDTSKILIRALFIRIEGSDLNVAPQKDPHIPIQNIGDNHPNTGDICYRFWIEDRQVESDVGNSDPNQFKQPIGLVDPANLDALNDHCKKFSVPNPSIILPSSVPHEEVGVNWDNDIHVFQVWAVRLQASPFFRQVANLWWEDGASLHLDMLT